MKAPVFFLVVAVVSIFWGTTISAQAICQDNIIYFPNNHPVTYAQHVYKNARQINELVFPVINENLSLRVYYPSDLQAGEQRPLIALVHGGGFVGGSYSDFFQTAEQLASLGYVAASIQYRLCKRNDCLVALNVGIPCNVSWGNSMIPAAYVAAVDVADAIRWLKDNHEDFHIDPENIIVGGYSAGAITALNVAFSSKEEFNQICAGCGSGSTYLSETLTSPEGIKGVISLAGAMFKLDWIEETENDIAVIMVHGTSDGAVSYQQAPVYPCCGTYSSIIYGSCKITDHLHTLGNDYYLITAKGYGHDLTPNSLFTNAIEQITGAVAKVVNCQQTFQKHAIIENPNPVLACPPPITNIPEDELCGYTATDLLEISYEIPVSTSAPEQMIHILAGPNPADQFIRFYQKAGTEFPNAIHTFSVYNVQGIRVYHQSGALHFPLQISTHDWLSGVYYAVFSHSEENLPVRVRFVKF